MKLCIYKSFTTRIPGTRHLILVLTTRKRDFPTFQQTFLYVRHAVTFVYWTCAWHTVVICRLYEIRYEIRIFSVHVLPVIIAGYHYSNLKSSQWYQFQVMVRF